MILHKSLLAVPVKWHRQRLAPVFTGILPVKVSARPEPRAPRSRGRPRNTPVGSRAVGRSTLARGQFVLPAVRLIGPASREPTSATTSLDMPRPSGGPGFGCFDHLPACAADQPWGYPLVGRGYRQPGEVVEPEACGLGCVMPVVIRLNLLIGFSDMGADDADGGQVNER